MLNKHLMFLLITLISFIFFGCAGSSSKKMPPPCGNALPDEAEECDDGNTLSGDGCSSRCELEQGWTCSTTFPTVCTPVCGDGLVVGLEECDDKNSDGGDGCSPDCTVEPGYSCEAMPSVCITTCGDQVRAGEEECDDGNTDSGDGCSPDCTVEPGWFCEGSPSVCDAALCSDQIAAGDEECDGADLRGLECTSLGYDAGELGCLSDCQLDTAGCTYCGDGVCAPGEACPADCGAVKISLGLAHVCALTATKKAYCWGFNNTGQLGNGRLGLTSCLFNLACDPEPQRVLGIDELADIHAGTSISCGIKPDQSLWCWGSNRTGQLGDGRANHGITCNDDDCSLIPVPVSLEFPVFSVASGYDHACALTTSGSVYCWGSNEYGQLGDGNSSHGTTCSGVDCSRVPVAVALHDVVQIDANSYFTCALRSNGTVWCWGQNHAGQLGNNSTQNRNTPIQVSGLSQVSQVDLGFDFACARKTDSTIWCWGSNSFGQLGDRTTTNRSTPVRAGTILGSRVSGGGEFTCVMKADNSWWCWGNNNSGQLGDQGTSDSLDPVELQSAPPMSIAMAGIWYYVCGLGTEQGQIYCWGNNVLGQLGTGNLSQVNVPTPVEGILP